MSLFSTIEFISLGARVGVFLLFVCFHFSSSKPEKPCEVIGKRYRSAGGEYRKTSCSDILHQLQSIIPLRCIHLRYPQSTDSRDDRQKYNFKKNRPTALCIIISKIKKNQVKHSTNIVSFKNTPRPNTPYCQMHCKKAFDGMFTLFFLMRTERLAM